MRVSFDYWGTLSVLKYQKEAKACCDRHEVFLITRGKYIEDAKKVAAAIGIKADHVISTEGEDKGEVMNKLGIDIHYDDDKNQIAAIQAVSKTYCVHVNKKAFRNSNWDYTVKHYI